MTPAQGRPLWQTGLALALAVLLLVTYVETGLVPRFPTAILCSALVLLSAVLLACGLILGSVAISQRRAK